MLDSYLGFTWTHVIPLHLDYFLLTLTVKHAEIFCITKKIKIESLIFAFTSAYNTAVLYAEEEKKNCSDRTCSEQPG